MNKFLATVCGLLLGGSLAFAQEIPFEVLDLDGDGVLTLEEAMAHPEVTPEVFDDADVDGTGTLTQEQYENIDWGGAS